MKLKILVNLNRIPLSYNIKDDFEKAQLYLFGHGVDVSFTFKDISVNGYSSVYTNGRWLLDKSQTLIQLDTLSDINMFVFDQAEWANPPGSQFPLKPNTPNGNCFLLQKPFINIGAYQASNQETCVQIAHEIMHALAMFSNLAGFHFADVMDTYFHNNDWNFPRGNFAQQWTLLQPYLLSEQPVILTRHTDDGVQTMGDMQVGNVFSRATLERPWKNNQKNISCIPKGAYRVRWTFSPKFMRYTYEVQNIPQRSGIRFHSGNYFFDVDGCILLGTGYQDINHDGKMDVINSKMTIKAFEDLMQRKDFNLEII